MIFIIVGVFILFPIIAFPFLILGMIFSKRFSKIYLVLFCSYIATLGLYHEPTISSDATRVLARLAVYEYWDLNTLLNFHAFSKEPISQLLFWISSQTDNHKFAFAISGFFVYFFILYPVLDFLGIRNSNTFTRFLAIIMGIASITLVSAIGAVRFPLGYAVMFFGWYYGLIKGNHFIAIFLSIIAIGIHNSYIAQFIILLVTLIVFKLEKNKIKINKFIIGTFLIWGLFNQIISDTLGKFSNIALFNTIGDKFDIYIDRGYNSWYLMLGISGATVIIIALISIKYYLSKLDNNEKNIRYFSILIMNYMLFTLGSIIYANIFVRLLIFSSLLSVFIFIVQERYNNGISLLFKVIICCASITGLIYQINMFIHVEDGWINFVRIDLINLWYNAFNK